MPRSIWTNEERDDLVEIRVPPANTTGLPRERWDTCWVEPEHVDDVKRVIARAERLGPYGLLALLLFFPALFVASLLAGPRVLGPGICAFAVCAFFVAVPTPQTVGAIGLRDAMIVVRAGAAFLLLVGVWALIAAP